MFLGLFDKVGRQDNMLRSSIYMLFMTCLGHELVANNILTKLSTLAATRNSQAVQVMNKLQNATLTKV